MVAVKLSSKYQIVIPACIRMRLNLKAGERLCLVQHDNRIEVIPVKTIKDMRGLLSGMNTDIKREEDRL